MRIALLGVVLVLVGCNARPPLRVVVMDGAFVESRAGEKGKPFRPWGFNYDRDYRMRLIEDYWDAEWATIERDFAEMRRMGANVVRVHLQVAKFMTGPDRMNNASLEKLRQLVALAKRNELRLDITGLACYRRSYVPKWYAELDEARRWEAQAFFWANVVRACGDPEGVFCFNLVNEPSVPEKPTKDWLAGDMAGFTYCQVITLDAKGRDRTQLAVDWVKRMSAAIRGADPYTPITVGLLPFPTGTGFDAAALAPHLDFVAVHYYPDKRPAAAQAAFLRKFHTPGKPLVVEEIFPLKCDVADLAGVMEASKAFVGGWIGFYWGKPAGELEISTELGDVFTARWLRFFEGRNGPP